MRMRKGEDYKDMHEPHDPRPQGVVHDNNRGPYDANKQMKNKVFQAYQEIYNNPVRAHNGAIFDDHYASVPFNIDNPRYHY